MKNRKRTRSGNPKRRLREWPDRVTLSPPLEEQVEYIGSSEHKRNPGDFGLARPAAPRPDASLCDDAGIFSKREAQSLLEKGARLGLVDKRRDKKVYPRTIWSVRESDDMVFEAKRENAEQGHYHGYPLPKSDSFREVVLKAYAERFHDQV